MNDLQYQIYGPDLPPGLQLSTSAHPKQSPGLSYPCSPCPNCPTRNLHALSAESTQALSGVSLNSTHFLASLLIHPRPGHHLKLEQPHSLSVPANLSTRSHCVNPLPLKDLQSFGTHSWFSSPSNNTFTPRPLCLLLPLALDTFNVTNVALI